MLDIIYLIAFISTTFYGCNILADITYNRPISAHIGYGLVSIVSLYQIIPALSFGIIVIFTLYSAIMLMIWIDKQKTKKYENYD